MNQLEAIYPFLHAHFEQKDYLSIIGAPGNRFEHWFKWECVVALVQARDAGRLKTLGEIQVETEHQYDMLLHGADGAPDVRLELKARSTKGKGPSELANDMMRDQTKLRVAAQAYGGLGASLALVVGHREGAVADWADKVRNHGWLGEVRSNSPAHRLELLMDNSGKAIAALILFPV